MTADSVALACEKRRDRSQSQHPAGEMIGMNRTRTRRHPAFEEIPQPGHRARRAAVGAESDPIFPRTRRAHELAGGEHDLRVDRTYLGEAQTHSLHCAGGAVLDSHVRHRDEPFDDLEAALGAEVDAETALASARRGERRVHLSAEDSADEIGMRAGFDFDYVRSVFGE